MTRLTTSQQHELHPANLAWLMAALISVGLRREPEQMVLEQGAKEATNA